MKYKSITYTFLMVFFILAVTFFSVIFYYDPLKIFHKPWAYKYHLQSNMREQASGMLKHWEYDSLILGTSILENTSSKEASAFLGGKFINISIAGSDYYERSIILEYAFKNRELKTVLYSLDNLKKPRWGDTNYRVENWDYLYDDNIFNDVGIYLNSKYLTCLFSFTDKERCMGLQRDFDRPKAWFKVKQHIKTFGGFDKWIDHKEDRSMKHTLYLIKDALRRVKLGKSTPNQTNVLFDLTRMKKYLNAYILSYAQAYPDTEFILVVPPYSRLVYAMMAQTNSSAFSVYKQSIKYLVTLSDTNPNIKIYAWGNNSFLDNMSKYRDLTHFSEDINSMMLKSIQNENGLLTVDNVDSYLQAFTEKSLAYDFSYIEDKLKRDVSNQ